MKMTGSDSVRALLDFLTSWASKFAPPPLVIFPAVLETIGMTLPRPYSIYKSSKMMIQSMMFPCDMERGFVCRVVLCRRVAGDRTDTIPIIFYV